MSERIVYDPDVLGGNPRIKGTRISVEHVIGMLAAGETRAQILANYPRLTTEDVDACIGYAFNRAMIGFD